MKIMGRKVGKVFRYIGWLIAGLGLGELSRTVRNYMDGYLALHELLFEVIIFMAYVIALKGLPMIIDEWAEGNEDDDR
jgi:hypothetical protein